MMIRGFVVAAAVVGLTAPGCGGRGPYDDPCRVGYERLTECGAREQAPDESEVSACRAADPITRCVYECFAEASCDDLIMALKADPCAIIKNDFTDCLNVCDPRPTDC